MAELGAEGLVIRVQFRKTVSDGNYGNETHEVSYTLPAPATEDYTVELQRQAESAVLARLRASTNEGIRLALMTEEEREAYYKAQREERERRYAAERAKTQGEPAMIGIHDTPF
jgi:hypothetical protein